MPSLRLPPGARDAVKAGGGPKIVEAQEFDDQGRPTGALVSVVVFLDGEMVRSINEADYIAEQARLESDRAARQAVRQQVLAALDPLTGQLASTALTLPQAQAFVKALVFERGGIDPKTGRYVDPREWLK